MCVDSTNNPNRNPGVPAERCWQIERIGPNEVRIVGGTATWTYT